ncbi:hypothetical protein PSOS111911_19195 [Pseudoalteromonas ostreae]
MSWHQLNYNYEFNRDWSLLFGGNYRTAMLTGFRLMLNFLCLLVTPLNLNFTDKVFINNSNFALWEWYGDIMGFEGF